MKLHSIQVNREVPIGMWWPVIYCKSWHERFRFWLIGLLYKSFGKSRNVCYARVDTGSGAFTQEEK